MLPKAVTDASGYAFIDFAVTTQPGDNFRVAASVNKDAMDALTVADPSSPYCAAPNNAQIPAFGGTLSPMLTVWRKLWLEFDSMGPAPTSGPEKNFDEGVILSVEQNFPEQSQSTLTLNVALTDEENRYEFGFIDIDGNPKYTVLTNTDRPGGPGNPDYVVIEGTPATFDVIGKSFKIYDDDFVGNKYIPSRTLPYSLSGGTIIVAAFADSYIKPVHVPETYIDRDSTFYRNMKTEPELFSKHIKRIAEKKDLHDAARFWVVHLLAAWQGAADEDYDPPAVLPDEDVLDGISFDFHNTGIIAIEPVRERESPMYLRRKEYHTVTHEIGHQGGAKHEDMGIMVDGGSTTLHKFTPVSIKRFRQEPMF